mmetsp:Transcript_1023/g.1176  ORF Transcript_1023/g.1176 Transcript_1023/m.1176 type:complete len:159 (+) Transcript_1023:100-576(+)
MIKFYQSWCGHCMRMKADWDRLAEEESNDSVLIADVNCGEQKDLCDEQGVTGYPTIYYYVDGQEEAYTGARSFEELSDFVTENLAKSCTFDEIADCSERALKYVQKWKVKSEEEMKKEVSRLEGMVKESMKSDLKKWIKQRIKILSSGSSGDDSAGEL